MADFFFWLLMLLIFVTIFAWPTWPYTHERWPYIYGGGYSFAASALAATLAVLLLLMFWFGLVAINWPWVAVPVAVQ